MIRFIAIRLIGAVVVVWIVSVVTFLIFQAVPLLSHTQPRVLLHRARCPSTPGSPQLLALEHRFGFDLPLYAQYWHYLSGILFGKTITDGVSTPIPCGAPCFGYSFRQNELVGTLILRALPVSLSLCIGASILWLIGGVTVGTVSALRPRLRHRPRRHGRLARRRVAADLLHRPDPAAGLRVHARLVARRLLRAPHAGPRAVVAEHDPAVDLAGLPVRGAVRPAHPLQHDGDDGRGLHPHRAGEGPRAGVRSSSSTASGPR